MKSSMLFFNLLVLSITFVCVRSYIQNGFKSISSLGRANSYISMMDKTNSAPLSTKEISLSNIRKFATPFFAVLSTSMLLSSPLRAADETSTSDVAPVKVELGPAPTDFGLVQNDYYADCQKIVNHMRYVVQLEKGNPLLAELAQKTKDEMTDFVSFYRRFQGISGKQSFSLLYTSINVLAGHYTSYGVKIPVPEKRKKRLLQEFNDIEKNIRKKR